MEHPRRQTTCVDTKIFVCMGVPYFHLIQQVRVCTLNEEATAVIIQTLMGVYLSYPGSYPLHV